MTRLKDFVWTHCTTIPGSTNVKCNWCLEDINGGIYRFKWHLSKERGNNTEICKRCSADVSYQTKQALEGIADSKAKKARTGVELGSSSANARRNRLSEEDGEEGGFNESGSTPSSIARGPTQVEETLVLPSNLVLHRDRKPLWRVQDGGKISQNKQRRQSVILGTPLTWHFMLPEIHIGNLW
ncbi:hypothetical protein SUGI_1054760 [Cryptomeria japonica]|nr:hypothetical protein SUGI_1054760 [Cryptomeria japonica]